MSRKCLLPLPQKPEPQRVVIIWAPGVPVAKGRPRLGRTGHPYTPEKTKVAQDALSWEMRRQCQGPLAGPLVVSLGFAFRAPGRLGRKARESLEEQEAFRAGRPDLDNLVKLVLDAANGILWRDDAQVVRIEATKHYGEEAGTTVNVSVAEGSHET